MEQRQVSEIVFREDLYPRIKHDIQTVEKYAANLDVLPPIEINDRNELIDGWHRWTAHRRANAELINVEIIPTQSDVELLELAIQRNAKHGLQLSEGDKQDMARKLYAWESGRTPEDRANRKKAIAATLSCSYRLVADAVSKADKAQAREERDLVNDLWTQCYTQQEIADRTGLSQPSIVAVLSEFAALQKPIKVTFSDEQWEPKIYDFFRSKKGSGSKHFGHSHAEWVEQLIYSYTEPGEIVVDPFGGSGSTLDLCRTRGRRCWLGDRKPPIGQEKDIRKHDIIVDGLPQLKRNWSEVALVYLDPPYWRQAQGQYSDDPEDFGNMPLEEFHECLAKTMLSFFGKLRDGAHMALIIQPTQWKADERDTVNHAAHMIHAMFKKAGAPVEQIQAPFESEQYNAQQLEWARDNRKRLVVSRTITVWRK